VPRPRRDATPCWVWLSSPRARGGMPVYKFVCNRILTTVENRVAGMDLSEWHSGYRAYSVAALKALPFERNSDGFDFDTQIILQLHAAGRRIAEVPIPTYYGDEICYVNGLRYAADVTRAVIRYRAHRMGFGTGDSLPGDGAYEAKLDADTSHGRILAWLDGRPRLRVLDLGCSDGALGERVRACGHEVTGVDAEKHDGVGDRLDRFFEADLDSGIPAEVGDGFDVVLAADVLEHVRRPDLLLSDVRERLSPGGSVIVSVPNFAHWYPRRGSRPAASTTPAGSSTPAPAVLHPRSFRRLAAERFAPAGEPSACRSRVVRGATAPPAPSRRRSVSVAPAARASTVRRRLWPSLFAYQFLFELDPSPARLSAAHRDRRGGSPATGATAVGPFGAERGSRARRHPPQDPPAHGASTEPRRACAEMVGGAETGGAWRSWCAPPDGPPVAQLRRAVEEHVDAVDAAVEADLQRARPRPGSRSPRTTRYDRPYAGADVERDPVAAVWATATTSTRPPPLPGPAVAGRVRTGRGSAAPRANSTLSPGPRRRSPARRGTSVAVAPVEASQRPAMKRSSAPWRDGSVRR